MKKIKDKIVLITGGAAGIGFCTAELFARAGSKVIITDIKGDALAAAKEKLRKKGLEVYSYTVDVSKKEQVENMAASIIKKFKTIDVLINNAGIGHTGELIDTDYKTWQRLMDVNFWGVLHHVYAFLPAMIKKRGGSIINVSSGQAFFRLPTWGAYASIKQAMAAFSEVLHYEVSKFNISVTTVYPFMVNTGFYNDVKPETWAAKLSMKLVPYYSMKPESVAKLIFKAVKKGQPVERVSIINDIGFYAKMVPHLSGLISSLTNYVLAKDAGAVRH
ncbi:MAG: SDR family oxidoreductase [Deltaproteobacteria bacterium]|nr:SDR family oxidoreductase [Deltaproteobacteria bacterium]